MSTLEEKISSHFKRGEIKKAKLDTKYNRRRDKAEAKRSTAEREFREESQNLAMEQHKFEQEHGYWPSDEEVEAGMERVRARGRDVGVFSLMDFLSLLLSFWYWISWFAVAAAAVGVASVWSLGEWAHRAVAEGMGPDDSRGQFHFRVFRRFLFLILLCALIGVLAAIRIWILAEEKRLIAQLSDADTFLTEGLTYFLSAVIGLFTFGVSIVLAKKYFDYVVLRDVWVPLYRALMRSRRAAIKLDKLTAKIRSIGEKRTAAHRKVDLRVQRKDEWSRWWDDAKKKIRSYMFEKPSNGSRGGSVGPVSVIIFAILLFQESNAQSYVNAFGLLNSKKGSAWCGLFYDATYSVSNQMRARFVQAVASLIQAAEDGDMIEMGIIDGGWKASGQMLFSETLPERSLVFQNDNLMARLRARKVLTKQLDSLLSLRDPEYRWRTEIIYAFNYIASRINLTGAKRAIILLCSDMVEESDLVDMSKAGFEPNALLSKLRSLNLIPDLKGATVMVITPSFPMKQANLSVKRTQFWMQFLRTANAACLWFGPDWVAFDDYVKRNATSTSR